MSNKEIECPLCEQIAYIRYTKEYEYIYCDNCKRKIMPEEQVKMLRKKVEND